MEQRGHPQDCQGRRQGSRVLKAKRAFPASNHIIEEVNM